MSSDVDKYMELEEKKKDLEKKIIRIEEQYRSKKQAMVELVEQIKKDGYDPKKLKEIIAEKEEEISNLVSDFENKLKDTSDKLSTIEAVE